MKRRNGFFMQLKGMRLKWKTQTGMICVHQLWTLKKMSKGNTESSDDMDLPYKESNLRVRNLKTEWLAPTFLFLLFVSSLLLLSWKTELELPQLWIRIIVWRLVMAWMLQGRGFTGGSVIRWVSSGCGWSSYFLSALCVPGRAVGAKAAAASGLGPVPASWSLCSVSGGTLRNTKCARSGGNPGLQEPIRIGSCVLFLCSVIERVRRWPEHWKPVWALLFGKLIKPQVPHWGILHQNLQSNLTVADCNKIASQPASQSVFTK